MQIYLLICVIGVGQCTDMIHMFSFQYSLMCLMVTVLPRRLIKGMDLLISESEYLCLVSADCSRGLLTQSKTQWSACSQRHVLLIVWLLQQAVVELQQHVY